jgi:adenylate cyclase
LLIAAYLLFGLSVSFKRIKFENAILSFVLATLAAFLLLVGIASLFLYITSRNPIELFARSGLGFQLSALGLLLFLAVVIAFLVKLGKSMQEFVHEIGAIALAVGVYIAAYQYSNYLFQEKSVLLFVVPIALTVALTYAATILYQYFTESRQKKMIKGFFNTYVPPTLVEEMINNPNVFKLGGERRELTMFFSDIKGFTNISEGFKKTPEKLVELMNEYLGAMTEIVFKYGGTLDKYIGDAVVAFWNAPLAVDDHPVQACYAALEMQEKLVELRAKFKLEGKPEVFSRMGLNTAEVIVGNMGSSGRFAYTAMGDGMNLASRLEAANKAFGTYIMISEFTYERVKDYCQCRWLATIKVQGKDEPIRVYELVARKEPGKVYEELEPAETAKKGVMAIAKE